jgi:AraC family transcriptional activator of mtrCDE
MDWLSRHFEIDLRCFYGAPWRIDQGPSTVSKIPYHAVVGGSEVPFDQAYQTGLRPCPLRRSKSNRAQETPDRLHLQFVAMIESNMPTRAIRSRD